MSKDITVELQFFMTSILWGALILLAYDILRIFRRVIKHNYFTIAIEDLLFWVIASVFIFAMMYNENNGIIRGFSVMGMALGMVVYNFMLSPFVVKLISELMILLLRPFRFIDNSLKRFSKFLLCKFRKLIKLLRMRLIKIAKSVKIKLNEKRNKRLAKRRDIKAKKEEKKERKKKLSKRRELKKRRKKSPALRGRLKLTKKVGKGLGQRKSVRIRLAPRKRPRFCKKIRKG
ncbi:MAG: hypothetical protein GX288_01465 [Clostridiales bacterium]|nr:hypothetical protein [Clostridiales bacterium]